MCLIERSLASRTMDRDSLGCQGGMQLRKSGFARAKGAVPNGRKGPLAYDRFSSTYPLQWLQNHHGSVDRGWLATGIRR